MTARLEAVAKAFHHYHNRAGVLPWDEAAESSRESARFEAGCHLAMYDATRVFDREEVMPHSAGSIPSGRDNATAPLVGADPLQPRPITDAMVEAAQQLLRSVGFPWRTAEVRAALEAAEKARVG